MIRSVLHTVQYSFAAIIIGEVHLHELPAGVPERLCDRCKYKQGKGIQLTIERQCDKMNGSVTHLILPSVSFSE